MHIVEEHRTRTKKVQDLEARRLYIAGGGVIVASRRVNGWGSYRSGIWHRAGYTLADVRAQALAFAAAPIVESRRPAVEPDTDELWFEGEEWL